MEEDDDDDDDDDDEDDDDEIIREMSVMAYCVEIFCSFIGKFRNAT
jgi:hypothetical protein